MFFFVTRRNSGPSATPTKPHPGFEHRDGAGEGAGAASDLDLAQAGLAVDGEQQTAFLRGSRNIGAAFVFSAGGVPAFVFCRARALGGAKDLDPAGSVFALAGTAIEADDFGAAQSAGETDRQNGAVAQSAQIIVQRGQHGQKIVGELFSSRTRRAAMGAANAGQHGGDMAILGVERLA